MFKRDSVLWQKMADWFWSSITFLSPKPCASLVLKGTGTSLLFMSLNVEGRIPGSAPYFCVLYNQSLLEGV